MGFDTQRNEDNTLTARSPLTFRERLHISVVFRILAYAQEIILMRGVFKNLTGQKLSRLIKVPLVS